MVADGYCYIQRGWATYLDESGGLVVQDMDAQCSVSCPAESVKMGYEMTPEA